MEKTKDSVAKATIFDKIKAGISNIIHWAIVASPWIVLVAILPVFFVTHYTRVHQVAITASYACTAIALIVFFGMYIEGNSYKAFSGNRKKPKMAPFNMLLILLSVAMFFMFIPVYDSLEGTDGARTFFLSIHNTIRLYVVDADYGVIKDYLAFEEYTIHGTYATVFSVYTVIMFVVAPFMTAGFVLSFIKDAWAQILYVVIPGGDKTVYYMSELNSRSIALARDIRRQEAEKRLKRSIIVFFDVYHEQNEEHHELMTRASSYGAICFRKDISATGLVRWRKSRKFFFIGENEEENVKQAITLVDRCRESLSPRCNAEFYVFTTASDSEQLIDAIDRARPNAKRPSHQKDFKIRRVDVTRNLAISTVEENYKIFPNSEATEVKQVDIVIVGVGDFGTELLKAYCWASQLPNCQAVIHLIDKDKHLKDRLEYQVPALVAGSGGKALDGKYNDSFYKVIPHENIDVTIKAFENEIEKIATEASDGIDAVFVALGNDELNVRVAADIRRIIGRLNTKTKREMPKILSTVYSTRKTDVLPKDVGVDYIGSMEAVYSLKNVENLEHEKRGFEYHKIWVKGECKRAWNIFSGKIVRTTEYYEKTEKTYIEDDVNEGKKGDNLARDFEEIRDNLDTPINSIVALVKDLNRNLSIGDEVLRSKIKAVLEKEARWLYEMNFEEQKSKFEIHSEKITVFEKEILNKATLENQSIVALINEMCPGCRLNKKDTRKKLENILKEISNVFYRIVAYKFVLTKSTLGEQERSYDTKEYNRRSSIARAVHVAILESLGYYVWARDKDKGGSPVPKQLEIEHARWNAFMRGENWIYGKEKQGSYKIHNDLRVFSELTITEREKDNVYNFLSGEAE